MNLSGEKSPGTGTTTHTTQENHLMKYSTQTHTVTQTDRDKARELTNQANAQTALAKDARKKAKAALRRSDHRTFEKYASREMGHSENAQAAYAAARRLLDPTGE